MLAALLLAAPRAASAEEEGPAAFPDAERAAAALGSTNEARRAAARAALRTLDLPADRTPRVARALSRALAVARDTDRPDERQDRKVLEVLIELEPNSELPIGLRVDVFAQASR